MKRRLSLLLIAVLLIGCKQKKHEPSIQKNAKKVDCLAVHYKKFPIIEQVNGTVSAKERAIISSKIAGTVDKLCIQLGKKVQKGDELVVFKADEILAKVSQAKAQSEQARLDLKRIESLFNQHAATESERDRALYNFKTAEASTSEAQIMESYATIQAPFSGTITRKYVNEGDTLVIGKPLFEIEDIDHLQVESDIPEQLITNIQVGQLLKADIGNNIYSLLVTEISPSADTLSRTFLLKADIIKSEVVKSGMFARVEIPSLLRNMLVIPPDAIIKRGQLEEVFVVQDNRAYMRLIRTGSNIFGNREVVSGLDDGEIIILNPKDIKDGTLIKTEQ